MPDNRDIALQAWQMVQDLAGRMGENAWKITSVFYALSAALVSYGYTSDSRGLFLIVPPLAVAFLLLEGGFRVLQDQYIAKSLAIERTLKDIIVGEKYPRFPDSFGTGVEKFRLKAFLRLFRLARFTFWLPYAVLAIVPLVLWCMGFTAGTQPSSPEPGVNPP